MKADKLSLIAVLLFIHGQKAVKLSVQGDVWDSYDQESQVEQTKDEDAVDPAALAAEIGGDRIAKEVIEATGSISDNGFVQTDDDVELAVQENDVEPPSDDMNVMTNFSHYISSIDSPEALLLQIRPNIYHDHPPADHPEYTAEALNLTTFPEYDKFFGNPYPFGPVNRDDMYNTAFDHFPAAQSWHIDSHAFEEPTDTFQNSFIDT